MESFFDRQHGVDVVDVDDDRHGTKFSSVMAAEPADATGGQACPAPTQVDLGRVERQANERDASLLGQDLATQRFRRLLEDTGYQVISADETGDPGVTNPRGWCEVGQIDRRGHDMQLGLAGQIEDQISLLAERIV